MGHCPFLPPEALSLLVHIPLSSHIRLSLGADVVLSMTMAPLFLARSPWLCGQMSGVICPSPRSGSRDLSSRPGMAGRAQPGHRSDGGMTKLTTQLPNPGSAEVSPPTAPPGRRPGAVGELQPGLQRAAQPLRLPAPLPLPHPGSWSSAGSDCMPRRSFVRN